MKWYPKVWACCFLLIIVWSALLGMRYHAGLLQLQHSNRSVASMVKAGRQFEPIAFPVSDIRWLKPHEINFNGQKFDLKSWHISGDTLYTMAYHDTRETELEKKLHDDAQSDGDTIMIQMHAVYYICPDIWEFPPISSCALPATRTAHVGKLPIFCRGKWNPPRA
jgi:hypothetical protein